MYGRDRTCSELKSPVSERKGLVPTKKALNKQLEELDAAYQSVIRDYNQARLDLFEYKKASEPTKVAYAASLSLDIWPLSDWARLGIDRFNPGRYFQLRLGPIRFDFYEG